MTASHAWDGKIAATTRTRIKPKSQKKCRQTKGYLELWLSTMSKHKSSSSLSRVCFAVELSSAACPGLWHKSLPGIGDVLETLQQEPLWPTPSLCGVLKHWDFGDLGAKNLGWCDGPITAHRSGVGRKARGGKHCMDPSMGVRMVGTCCGTGGQSWDNTLYPACSTPGGSCSWTEAFRWKDRHKSPKKARKPNQCQAQLLVFSFWWWQLQQCLLLGGGAAPSRGPLGFPTSPHTSHHPDRLEDKRRNYFQTRLSTFLS